jgi:protein involved in polysaccharide export with SLBB domain
LREPKVTVRILDRSGRPTSVVYGAVKTPQRFQIRRPARLSELIILSGGLTERASGEIQIFRSQNMSCETAEAETKFDDTPAGASASVEKRERFVSTRRDGEDGGGGGSTYIKVSIADLLKGKPEANPIILTGDIVTIQEAAPIYVIGGVAAPKQISAREQTTVARAVAAAGGPTKDADTKKVRIFRRQAAETKIIEVDLEAVIDGKAEDVPLRAFDVVEVSRPGRDGRKFPPVMRAPDAVEKNILNLPLRVVE